MNPVKKIKSLVSRGKEKQNDFNTLATDGEVSTPVFRTPTEVAIDWMNTLQNKVVNSHYNPQQKHVIENMLNAYKERWMAHEFTIDSTKIMLEKDSETLRNVGLDDLADKAFSQNKQGSLYSQLPRSNDFELTATRLNDNVYGRKFESEFIKYTVDHTPKNVLDAMTKTAEGLQSLLKQDDIFMTRVQDLVRNDYRPWFQNHPEITSFVNASSADEAHKILTKILSSSVDNGSSSMLVGYLGQKIYMSLGSKESLIMDTQNWYKQGQDVYKVIDIIKNTGIVKNYAALPTESIQTSLNQQAMDTFQPGISFTHQKTDTSVYTDLPVSTVPDKRIAISDRPVQTHLLKVDSLGSTAKLFLEHGAPSAASVSGTTNIWMTLLSHFKNDLKMDLNVKDAFIGVMQFLNYDGGHSINEILWTAHLRENIDKLQTDPNVATKDVTKLTKEDMAQLQLDIAIKGLQKQDTDSFKIGLDGFISKISPDDPIKFVADYESLISSYEENSPVRALLQDAKEHAFNKVFEHFQKYSQYATLDAPEKKDASFIAIDIDRQEAEDFIEQKQKLTPTNDNDGSVAIETDKISVSVDEGSITKHEGVIHNAADMLLSMESSNLPDGASTDQLVPQSETRSNASTAGDSTSAGLNIAKNVGISTGMLGLGAAGTVHSFQSGDILNGALGAAETATGAAGLGISAVSATNIVQKSAIGLKIAGVASKAIPVAGAGFSVVSMAQDAKDIINSAQSGDAVGIVKGSINFVLDGATAVADLVPGVGTVAALGLAGTRMVSDSIIDQAIDHKAYEKTFEVLHNPESLWFEKATAAVLGSAQKAWSYTPIGQAASLISEMEEMNKTLDGIEDFSSDKQLSEMDSFFNFFLDGKNVANENGGIAHPTSEISANDNTVEALIPQQEAYAMGV